MMRVVEVLMAIFREVAEPPKRMVQMTFGEAVA